MSSVTYTATKGLKHIGTEVLSCCADTNVESAVGSNLITNGTFPTDLAGWTDSSSVGGAIAWNASTYMDLINTTGNAIADQVFTTVVGETFVIHVNKISNTCSIKIGSAQSLTDLHDGTEDANDETISFTATTTATWIRIINTSAGTTAQVDDIACRLSDTDLSATQIDLAHYGTLTKAAAATGSEVIAYSGFGGSNYVAHLAYVAATDLVNEVTCIGWIKTTASSSEVMVGNYTASGDNGGYQLAMDSTGVAQFTVRSDAGANVNATGTTNITDDEWHFLVGTMDTDGNVKIYVNGALDDTTASGVLGQTGTKIHVGLDSLGTNEVDGSIALIRILSGALTAAQIKTIYDSEKHMFKANSVFTQVDENYSLDLSVDQVERSESVESNAPISLGGKQETVFQRADVFYNLNIKNVPKATLPEYRVFLQSVNGGQTFTFDPYGTVASPDDPISVIADGGHNETRVNTLEYFNISMKLREV